MYTCKASSLGLTLALSLLLSSCSTQVAGRLGSFELAVGSTIADPRISEKIATVDEEGVQVAADKHAASKQFMAAIEKTLPQIVEAAVRAALISAGIGVIGAVPGGAPDVPTE